MPTTLFRTECRMAAMGENLLLNSDSELFTVDERLRLEPH